MTSGMLRVVKVGGSLWDYPPLPQQLVNWLLAQPPAGTILITGGGPWAEAVRQVDALYHLPEEFAHALAVRTMGIAARLLASLLPDCGLVTDWQELKDLIQSQSAPWMASFDVRRFLVQEEPLLDGTKLPSSWDVTSDSIAARLSVVLNAQELVLLKSASCPAGTTPQTASASEHVDRFFPQIARQVRRIRSVNLRADGWPQTVLAAE